MNKVISIVMLVVLVVVIVFSVLLMVYVVECSKVVILVDFDYVFLYWYDGKCFIGVSIEIVMCVLSVFNIFYEVCYVGFFYCVFKEVESGEVVMVFLFKNMLEC